MTVYRVPPGTPRLTLKALTAWLEFEPDRALGQSIWIRRYGTEPKAGLPPVISIELHGRCIALLKPNRVIFPETGDARPVATFWRGRIIADNQIGRTAVRIARRQDDGQGPPVSRGHAGLLVINGNRDRPVEGFAYRPGHPGEEPWCNHDGPGERPGRVCECGQVVPRHSDYRERKAAEMAAAIAARAA